MSSSTRYPNIILIVIDTLRNDYAKPLEEMLQKEGFIVYENAISTAPWTLPSHASILTGLYPIFHRAHETRKEKMLDVKLVSDNLLNSKLSEFGYKTYLLSANTSVSPFFGFKGFDYFYDASTTSYKSILSEEERKKFMKISVANTHSKIKNIKSSIKNDEIKLLSKVVFDYILHKMSLLYNLFRTILWKRVL